jgi:hypothetical protein
MKDFKEKSIDLQDLTVEVGGGIGKKHKNR